MKRLLFLVTLLFIFSIIPFNVKAEKAGPVIKGFQLGQTLDELRVAADKLGLIVEPIGTDALAYNYAAISKDNADKKNLLSKVAGASITLVYFRINNDNNTATKICFTDKALTELFHATGRRTGFLQAFVDNYDEIDRLERVQEYSQFTGVERILYQYISDQEGWMIRIHNAFSLEEVEASTIELTAIEKTGAFKF